VPPLKQEFSPLASKRVDMMPRLLRFKAEDTVADQDDAQGDTPAEQSGPAIQLFAPRSSLLTRYSPTIRPRHTRREIWTSKLERYLYSVIPLILTFTLPPRNLLHPAPSRRCPTQSMVSFAASLVSFSLRRKVR